MQGSSGVVVARALRMSALKEPKRAMKTATRQHADLLEENKSFSQVLCANCLPLVDCHGFGDSGCAATLAPQRPLGLSLSANSDLRRSAGFQHRNPAVRLYIVI